MIIADEFVGIVTSMPGCSGIDPNLGHQLFKIIFFCPGPWTLQIDVTQLSYPIPFITNNLPSLHETCSWQRTLH